MKVRVLQDMPILEFCQAAVAVVSFTLTARACIQNIASRLKHGRGRIKSPPHRQVVSLGVAAGEHYLRTGHGDLERGAF